MNHSQKHCKEVISQQRSRPYIGWHQNEYENAKDKCENARGNEGTKRAVFSFYDDPDYA
jgi:hypothetical protein